MTIDDRCPTFSWGGVQQARSYDLVVYRLSAADNRLRAVLRQRVPGTASVWTPSLDRCLERGARYAWAVRASYPDEISEWSTPNLFHVLPEPTRREFEEALRTVRAYINAADRPQLLVSDPSVQVEESDGASKERSTNNSEFSAEPSQSLLSVDGGITAALFVGDGSFLVNLNPQSLSAPVPVAKGGTGATSAGEALSNLGAASASELATLEARVATLEAFTGLDLTPVLASQPPSADFGSVPTSETRGLTVQISNTGNGPSGTLTATIVGSNSDEFSLLSDACSGSSLSPGTNCSIDVSFEPDTLGLKSASLTVMSATTSTSVALSGSGIDIPQDHTGFEFYAVPLANYVMDTSTFAFAVGLGNNGSSSANVNITLDGAPIDSVIVPAGSAVFVDLPWIDSLQTGSTLLASAAAYRIVSDQLISAVQYAPLETSSPPDFAYTSEASLLLPVHTLTGNYRVVGWPSWGSYPGQFAIVGTEDSTTVTVTPSTSIVAGGGLLSNGGTVVVNRGDVLQVSMPSAPASTYGSDPSGSLIAADKPVGVFAAHVLTNIPESTGTADHLEEQLPPVESLGNDFVFADLRDPAGTSVTRFINVVATTDGTLLSFNPAVAGAPSSLNAGESFTLSTSAAFRLTTSGPPVIAAAYLESHGGDDDPAMGLVVPTAGFLSSFQFLAPTQFAVNRASIAAPTGTTVTLDGVQIPLANFTPVGTTGFSVTDVLLSDSSAIHLVSSSAPVGVTVYGFAGGLAYMNPAGMALGN